MKYSTGFINHVLVTGSAKAAFTNCHIDLYSGAAPLSPDAAVTGTLLGSVTLNGDPFVEGAPTNGLNFGVATAGVLAKAIAEVWKITFVAGGTIGYFRLKANAVDNNGASTTLIRADGTVGITSGDMRLGSLTAVALQVKTVDEFNITATNPV
jgi:hypothetical protein